MAEKESTNEGKPFDPMEPWRGVRDAYLDAWSKTMVEMVNNEAYAQASGAMLNTSLTVSAPFREALEKSMLKALEQLAMPSRADIVSIAGRLTNIEIRLDDLDAKLDSMKMVGKAETAVGAPSAGVRKAAQPENTARGSKQFKAGQVKARQVKAAQAKAGPSKRGK